MNKKSFKILSEETEQIATLIVDAAFQVHKNLGPGLLINFNVPLIKQGIKRIIL